MSTSMLAFKLIGVRKELVYLLLLQYYSCPLVSVPTRFPNSWSLVFPGLWHNRKVDMHLQNVNIWLSLRPLMSPRYNCGYGQQAPLRYTKWQKQSPKDVLSKRCSENMLQIYRRTPTPKCGFNKVALELYWNHSSTWVSFCKFAAYFQNTIS